MVVKSSAVIEGETNFDAAQCGERREDESTAIDRMLIGRGGIATSGRGWHERNSGRLCPQSSSSCSNDDSSDVVHANNDRGGMSVNHTHATKCTGINGDSQRCVDKLVVVQC